MEFGTVENCSRYICEANDALSYFIAREDSLSLVYTTIDEQKQRSQYTAQILKKFKQLLMKTAVSYNQFRIGIDCASSDISAKSPSSFHKQPQKVDVKLPAVSEEQIELNPILKRVKARDNELQRRYPTNCAIDNRKLSSAVIKTEIPTNSSQKSELFSAKQRRLTVSKNPQSQKLLRRQTLDSKSNVEPRRRLTFNRDYPKPWLTPMPLLGKPSITYREGDRESCMQNCNMKRLSIDPSTTERSVPIVSCRPMTRRSSYLPSKSIRRASFAPHLVSKNQGSQQRVTAFPGKQRHPATGFVMPPVMSITTTYNRRLTQNDGNSTRTQFGKRIKAEKLSKTRPVTVGTLVPGSLSKMTDNDSQISNRPDLRRSSAIQKSPSNKVGPCIVPSRGILKRHDRRKSSIQPRASLPVIPPVLSPTHHIRRQSLAFPVRQRRESLAARRKSMHTNLNTRK